MIRVAISVGHHDPGTYADIEQIVGHNRVFIQGTDTRLYVDYTAREWADLDVANLNTIQGVKAHIEECYAD